MLIIYFFTSVKVSSVFLKPICSSPALRVAGIRFGCLFLLSYLWVFCYWFKVASSAIHHPSGIFENTLLIMAASAGLDL